MKIFHSVLLALLKYLIIIAHNPINHHLTACREHFRHTSLPNIGHLTLSFRTLCLWSGQRREESYDVKPEFKINIIVRLINYTQFQMKGDSSWRAMRELILFTNIMRQVTKKNRNIMRMNWDDWHPGVYICQCLRTL